jgi:hypothetical protein
MRTVVLGVIPAETLYEKEYKYPYQSYDSQGGFLYVDN